MVSLAACLQVHGNLEGLVWTYSGESLDFGPIWLEKGMPRLIFVVLCEFGVVIRLDIVSHLRSLDGFLVQFAVAKVVAIGKVTFVLRLALFCVWNGDEGLANVVLALDLFVGEARSSHREEAGSTNLSGCVLSVDAVGQNIYPRVSVFIPLHVIPRRASAYHPGRQK